MAKPSKPAVQKRSPNATYALMLALSALLISLGAYGGSLPNLSWRLFSYHPLLMCSGIAMFVSGALLKKLGGYWNTKVHGM